MNVGTICQHNVVTIGASEDLAAAAGLMREKHVGYLVVVEAVPPAAPKVVGVLTDRDIVVAVVARNVDPHSLTTNEVMTRDPLWADETDAIEETLRRMRDRGVRRVPVIGARGQLVGVLSVDDALDSIAGQLASIAESIRNEQRVERSTRR